MSWISARLGEDVHACVDDCMIATTEKGAIFGATVSDRWRSPERDIAKNEGGQEERKVP